MIFFCVYDEDLNEVICGTLFDSQLNQMDFIIQSRFPSPNNNVPVGLEVLKARMEVTPGKKVYILKSKRTNGLSLGIKGPIKASLKEILEEPLDKTLQKVRGELKAFSDNATKKIILFVFIFFVGASQSDADAGETRSGSVRTRDGTDVSKQPISNMFSFCKLFLKIDC